MSLAEILSNKDVPRKKEEVIDFNTVQNNVDELGTLREKIDYLTKKGELIKTMLRGFARQMWRKARDRGDVRNTIRIDGEFYTVSVSKNVRPKSGSLSRDELINRYGKEVFDRFFDDQLVVKPKSDYMELFLALAQEKGIPVHEFFDIARRIVPRSDCFDILAELDECTELEDDLYSAHNALTVTTRLMEPR